MLWLPDDQLLVNSWRSCSRLDPATGRELNSYEVERAYYGSYGLIDGKLPLRATAASIFMSWKAGSLPTVSCWQAYRYEEELYAIPARFSVPLGQGGEGITDLASSTDGLEAQKDKQPGFRPEYFELELQYGWPEGEVLLDYIGLAMTFGCVLSHCLEKSGAIGELAQWMIARLGARGDIFALGIVACLVSIPVFFGAAYVLLAPLCKHLSRLTGKNLLWYICTMNTGLLLTCCCILPAPGPLAIVGIIGADTGWYILYGALVIIPALLLVCQTPFQRRLLGAADISIEEKGQDTPTAPKDLPRPSTALSLALLLLPLVLILSGTAADFLPVKNSSVHQALSFVSNNAVAMFIAMLVAVGSLRKYMEEPMTLCIRKGLDSCSIVIVLGIGGSLAGVISESGMGTAVCEWLLGMGLPIYLTIYLVSAVLRIALSSGTTAMLTSAGIFAPVIASSGISPVLAGLSIGAATMAFYCTQMHHFGLHVNCFTSRQNKLYAPYPSPVQWPALLHLVWSACWANAPGCCRG